MHQIENKMIEFDSQNYRALADLLMKAIDQKDYFNGSVEYDTDEFYSTLTTTMIIYRNPEDAPQGGRIADIVPIWWQFDIRQQHGAAENDFSWRELKKHLIDA